MITIPSIGQTRCMLAASLVMAVSFVAASAQVQASPDIELPFVQTTVARWSSEARVFVGPLIAEDIAAQLAKTTAYLCSYETTRCEKSRDVGLRERVIRGYLADLLNNAPGVVSVMERIINEVGLRLSDFGWPAGPSFNRFVAVPLPPAGRMPQSLSYVHWDGPQDITSGATHALLAVGVHTFIATNADGSSDEVRFRAERSVTGARLHEIGSRSLSSDSPFAALPSRIEPQYERFCLAKPMDPSEPKYRTVLGRGQPGISRPSDFLAAETIRIRLEGVAPGCDTTCQRWVSVLVVQALADWRAGCTRCPASTLSLVEVEGDKFVAVRYIDWAQFVTDRNVASLGMALPPEAYIKTFLSAVGRIIPSMGFQRIEGWSDLSQLCSASDGASSGSDFGLPARSRARVCGSSPHTCQSTEGCKDIVIRLGGSDTCKGPLACGLPDNSVTLNSTGFRFTLARTASIGPRNSLSFGIDTGAQEGKIIPLFPIILHEVGHWFGLPHVESDVGSDGRDEVMVDTGGTDAMCISSAALNMVESAVDRDWPFRLTGTGALRYAPR